jgi:hypothetical protein
MRIGRFYGRCAAAASLALGVSFGIARAAAAEPAGAPTRSFEVAYTVFAPDAVGNTAAAAYFATRLNARPGWAAADVPTRTAGAWNQPAGSVAGKPRRVNLVQVNFGPWHDWLALVFDGPDGALTCAVRRPARQHVLHDGFFGGNESILPGRDQIDRNAVIELAGDFYHAMSSGASPAPHPLVRVRVLAQEAKAGRLDADVLAGAPSDRIRVLSKTDQDGMQALAMTALYQAGWSPTASGEASETLDLSVECQPDRYTVGARFSSPDGVQESAKKELLPASLYDGLRRLLDTVMPTRTPGVDFAALGTGPVYPIGIQDNLLLADQNGTLLAFDRTTGEKKWTLPSPPRRQHQFLYRSVSDLGGLVFVRSPGLNALDLTDGREGSMQSFAAPTYSWGVDDSAAKWVMVKARGAGHASHRNHDINVSGALLVASGRQLIAYEKAAALWSYTGSSALTAGPCRLEDRVIVGDRSGHVTALSNDDGHVLWTSDVGERLMGPVAAAGNGVVVASLEGTLFGLSAADGRLVWKRDLGDTAIAGPFSTASGIFVASGAFRLWLIDPGDGRVKASRTWPAALLTAVPLVGGDGFACSDAAGAITFLDPTNLNTRRQVRLHSDLTPTILPVASLSCWWGRASRWGKTPAPGVIVGDENGFVHLVSTDAQEEQPIDELEL